MLLPTHWYGVLIVLYLVVLTFCDLIDLGNTSFPSDKITRIVCRGNMTLKSAKYAMQTVSFYGSDRNAKILRFSLLCENNSCELECHLLNQIPVLKIKSAPAIFKTIKRGNTEWIETFFGFFNETLVVMNHLGQECRGNVSNAWREQFDELSVQTFFVGSTCSADTLCI